MKSSVNVSVNWYPGKLNEVLQVSDKIMYTVARITLDTSYTSIPLSNSKGRGKLRQSSMSAGVRGSEGNYYIGSYTSYAKYVWNMENVNWSTPNTFGKWYEENWKKNKTNYMKQAIERNKLK